MLISGWLTKQSDGSWKKSFFILSSSFTFFSFFNLILLLLYDDRHISYLIYENRMMWRCRAHICHEYHELYSWRKNCHVEKYREILGNFEKFWDISGNFATIYELSCGETLIPKVHLWRKKWQIWGLWRRLEDNMYLLNNYLVGVVKIVEKMGKMKIWFYDDNHNGAEKLPVWYAFRKYMICMVS